MVAEREVITAIRHSLDNWQLSKVVQWWERLHSLKIRHQGYWIKGCRPGTADFVAVVRAKNKQLCVVFIEAKSPKGQLRVEQVAFKSKYDNGIDIHVLTIRDVKDLNAFINNIGIDTLENWP